MNSIFFKIHTLHFFSLRFPSTYIILIATAKPMTLKKLSCDFVFKLNTPILDEVNYLNLAQKIMYSLTCSELHFSKSLNPPMIIFPNITTDKPFTMSKEELG